jgi:ABC-type Fe3+-hydroxamate transport system substrate-binding protein
MASQSFTDQLGRTVSLPFPPKRIISLVPSQTELLAYLGLDDQVCGITKFCTHPPHWKQHKSIVGGTKTPDLPTIRDLNPELIIANKEENEEAVIRELAARYPVWVSDVVSLKSALAMIAQVGELVGRQWEANSLVRRIRTSFSSLRKRDQLSVLYLIWRKPWMAAGTDTFINAMLSEAGYRNVAQEYARYPELTEHQIAVLNPQLIFLSSEPYPFRKKHQAELKAICPTAELVMVDGAMFSWYGSRLLVVPDYFNGLP